MLHKFVGSVNSCLVALFLLCGGHLSGQAAQDTASHVSQLPQPAARIDLSAVGYFVPSRMDRLSEDESSVSLGFVDANHLLLTFNPKKPFQRLASCKPDHQDRRMHAAILEIPSGKVVKEVDWYLHDRRPYLWPLSSGTFLLRRLNDLYVLDSNLHENLLLSSPKDLLWVSVTPDGSQIIVETAKDPDVVKETKPAAPDSHAKRESKFVAQFLDASTLALRRTVPLDQVVDLTGTSAGYVDLVHKDEIWLIRFGPSPTQRHNIARVRSRTIPSVFYASETSLLIGRCPVAHCDYSVSSFTVAGQRLWRQRWPQYRAFPAVARSEDNSRFGVSTLMHAPVDSSTAKPGGEYDPDDAFQLDPSQRDNFEQEIQVFETASGAPIVSVKVSPAVLSGQNFSISADGRRLAVLQGAGLELFDLVPMSAEEQTKFSLLRTEVPDLFAVDSPPGAASTPDGAIAQLRNGETREVATNSTPVAPSPDREDLNSTADTDDANRQSSASEEPESAIATPPRVITEQEMEAKAAPITTFKVSSRAVVVDVVVTDAKGHPVRGLQQQDFQLMEDGKPQQVRAFREFADSDSAAVTVSTLPPPSKPHPNEFTNDTHAPDPGAVTLILFDLLNTPSQDQVYARQQLIKFLESKPKNAQFALCTLTGGTSHLRLIQGFTPDETVLLAAARGNKDAPREVRWQSSGSGTRNSVGIVADLAQGGRASGFQNLLGALQGMQAEQLGTDTDERVAITVDSMMVLARYLSGIPGRKNVIWLSGAFPIAIAVPMGANDAASDNRNYSEKIKLVTNLLAEAQIAVYPVDVRGLAGGGFSADGSLSVAGPPVELAATSSAKILAPENTAAPRGLAEFDQQATERDTLTQVATATGGKAFYNLNGIKEAIATAVEQGSNYYSLAYSPANKVYNGRFRKIKILLADKKYSLHYRQGYFAEDVNSAKEADISRSARAAAMQQGSPPSRQILFSARVVPVGAKMRMNHNQLGEALSVSAKKPVLPAVLDVQHYSIDYSVEGSQLHFIPLEDETYRNMLTLMVASFDSQGSILTGISHLGVSNLAPSVYKEAVRGKISLHEEVDVPADAVSLRIGIQDQMSNHIGTVDIPLPVPPDPTMRRHVKQRLPEIEPD